MKRSPMPRRRTPMKRGRPPKSNAEAIERAARKRTVNRLADDEHRPVLARRLAKEARKASEWQQAREAVEVRSGGWCEGNWPGVCVPGRHRAHHVHHRRLRSQGGGHEMENLLHLCRPCHDHAHSHVADAVARGIILHASVIPDPPR